jgi:hypothetical protein
MTPALVLALLPLALAAAGESAPPLPSEAEVLRRFETAMGPGEARATLTAWRASGEVEGEEGTISIVRQRPNRVRVEIQLDGRRRWLGCDGDLAWEEGVGEGPPQAVPLEPEAAKRLQEAWADFDGPLFDPRSKKLEIRVEGWGTVSGRRSQRLSVTYPSGRAETWHLDAETYRPLERTTADRVWVFHEFERVSGVMLPKRFELREGSQTHRYRLETFEVEPPLDPAIFRLPQGVRPETPPGVP